MSTDVEKHEPKGLSGINKYISDLMVDDKLSISAVKMWYCTI